MFFPVNIYTAGVSLFSSFCSTTRFSEMHEDECRLLSQFQISIAQQDDPLWKLPLSSVHSVTQSVSIVVKKRKICFLAKPKPNKKAIHNMVHLWSTPPPPLSSFYFCTTKQYNNNTTSFLKAFFLFALQGMVAESWVVKPYVKVMCPLCAPKISYAAYHCNKKVYFFYRLLVDATMMLAWFPFFNPTDISVVGRQFFSGLLIALVRRRKKRNDYHVFMHTIKINMRKEVKKKVTCVTAMMRYPTATKKIETLWCVIQHRIFGPHGQNQHNRCVIVLGQWINEFL